MVNHVALDIPETAALSNFAVLETAMLGKFWKLCKISLASETVGYEYRLIPKAQKFFQKEIIRDSDDAAKNFVNFPNHVNQDAKATLFSYSTSGCYEVQ
jgi:hypothetical protein